MRHQLSNIITSKEECFEVQTQFFCLCRSSNALSPPWNPTWLSAGNVPMQIVPVLGHVSASLQGQTHENSEGNKGTGKWVVRDKRKIRKKKKEDGKEGSRMKASTGKLLKKDQGNHPCMTAHSFWSLFCSEVLVSRFYITSDCPETRPQEKQCSCLGQRPGCCLPKNIFIPLEVTILCFWKCNIWYKPRVLTYSFWKWRSHLGFSFSFWLKSF